MDRHEDFSVIYKALSNGRFCQKATSNASPASKAKQKQVARLLTGILRA
jgi:hypothetical protein